MSPMLTRRGIVATASLVVLGKPALAQAWPARPVRLVLPFAAGGAADVVIRIVAAHMAEATGQGFVVQNVTGGSGNIGTEQVVRAPADGSTFLVGSPGTLAINPHMFRSLPFSVSRDLVAASYVATFPQILVVNPRVPAQSTEDLIALARSRPGRLNYGSSGNGSTGHLITAAFNTQAGINVTHVPFRGGAPAAQALVSGDVEYVIDGLPTWLSYVGTPQIRILGVTSAQRWPGLPDVPAIGERVIPGFDLGSWVILAAPVGTPPEINARLAQLVQRAVADSEVRRRLFAAGALPVGSSPDEARQFHRAELEKWGRVVEAAGARVD